MAANAATSSWDLRQTILIAARTAVSAIALLSVLDREFILSKWLHWAIANWKEFFQAVFAYLPIKVHVSMQPFFVFATIITSTVIFDLVMNGGAGKLRQSHTLIALIATVVIVPHLFWYANSASLNIARADAARTRHYEIREIAKRKENEVKESCAARHLERCDDLAELQNMEKQFEVDHDRYEAEFVQAYKEIRRSLIVETLLALALAVLSSPQMFIWLACFMMVFVGINEFAMMFEGVVPRPPG